MSAIKESTETIKNRKTKNKAAGPETAGDIITNAHTGTASKTVTSAIIILALVSASVIFIKYGIAEKNVTDAVRLSAVSAVLAYASYTDIKEKKISNLCVLLVAALAVLRLADKADMRTLISGCIPAACIYVTVLIIEGVKRRRLIGRGDLKLLFVLGLHYEIVEMLYIILISCIMALGYFLVFLRDKKRGIALCPMIWIGVFAITLVR